MRLADFPTLADALDYAAGGETGFNFFDSRGRLEIVLPYTELRERARGVARRLLGLGLTRGDRVAMVAENSPEFPVLFFACQYAGLVPVALPISLNLGSHGAYVESLRYLLHASEPRLAVAPVELLPFLEEAAAELPEVNTESASALEELPDADVTMEPTLPHETAYLQFTSGSTRFPRGVVITEEAVMSNLQGICRHGLEVRAGDRSVSWLPFYHDMGLVGFLLGPVVCQISADYMRTRDFAIRPIQWLKLISRNRGTIAFSPPIGFGLCVRRLGSEDLRELDLSTWRAAGIGAEMIRAEDMEHFAEALKDAGFRSRAFLPCYGLAESTLAVTFAYLEEEPDVDRVDSDALAEESAARPSGADTVRVSSIVNCGRVLPEHEVVIRDDSGTPLPDRTVGSVTVRGPSVMRGYFCNAEATDEALTTDGWLDTGDLGYVTDGGLFITGRKKDLIILNGRNIWPQDLEHIAEQQPEVRVGDASAFEVVSPEGMKMAVLVVHCRTSDEEERRRLVSGIQRDVYQALGVHCTVDLVPPNTLPKTSSGKPSRNEARRGFLERAGWSRETPTGEVAGRGG